MKKLTTRQTLAIIAVAILITLGIFTSLARSIPISNFVPPTSTKELTPTQTLTPTLIPATEEPTDTYTAILLGNDYRSDSPNRNENAQQSDAFLIAHIKFSDPPKITVFNIARELYMPINTNGELTSVKVAQLYSIGEYELIEQYVDQVFGLEVDSIFAMNMDGFLAMMESLGEIELTATRYSKDKCGDEWVEYFEGEIYVLDAPQALCYARMRLYSPNGYFDRQERQFDVLVSLGEAVKNKIWDDPILGVQALSHVDEFVETNLTVLQLTEIIGAGLKVYNDGDYELRFVSMNTDILELHDRPTDKSPYLYRPTVELKEWIKENLQ